MVKEIGEINEAKAADKSGGRGVNPCEGERRRRARYKGVEWEG